MNHPAGPGSAPEPVHLSEFNPKWASKFEAERSRLAQALSPIQCEIHHIGSTAVPGIASKDCIDIMVVVEHLAPMEDYEEAMYQLGYVSEAVADSDRIFFRRSAPRSHHVHFVERDSWHYWRWILFRDYLLKYPDWAARYESLKRYLVEAVSGRRESYTVAKTEFVHEIERRAFAEHPDLLTRFSGHLTRTTPPE